MWLRAFPVLPGPGLHFQHSLWRLPFQGIWCPLLADIRAGQRSIYKINSLYKEGRAEFRAPQKELIHTRKVGRNVTCRQEGTTGSTGAEGATNQVCLLDLAIGSLDKQPHRGLLHPKTAVRTPRHVWGTDGCHAWGPPFSLGLTQCALSQATVRKGDTAGTGKQELPSLPSGLGYHLVPFSMEKLG